MSINIGSNTVYSKNKIIHLPAWKLIFEIAMIPYAILSIVIIWRYNTDFVAFTAFWVGISAFIYVIIGTIIYLYHNQKILRHYRKIGVALRMAWELKKILKK